MKSIISLCVSMVFCGAILAEDTEYGQLQLEQSTWGMPARIEKVARDTLRMQLPTTARTEVVGIVRAEVKR